MGAENKFLNIQEKATDSEALRPVLAQALDLKEAHSVPTLVLSRDQYAGLDVKEMQFKLSEDISAYALRPRVMDVRDIQNLAQSSADALLVPHQGKNSFFRAESGFAHEKGAGNFRDYFFSVVTPLDQNMSKAQYLNAILSGDPVDVIKTGGSFEDGAVLMSLHTLLHEYSHTSGAAEPQAEKMASVLFRQVASPQIANPFLGYLSDMRTVNSVFKSDVKEMFEQYGWSMTRVLDAVMEMPENEIDALSKYDVRSMRYEHHDLDSIALRTVGNQVFGDKQEYKTADGKLDPEFLSICGHKAKDVLAQEIFRPFSVEYEILERLILATKRLQQGEAAYQPLAEQSFAV